MIKMDKALNIARRKQQDAVKIQRAVNEFTAHQIDELLEHNYEVIAGTILSIATVEDTVVEIISTANKRSSFLFVSKDELTVKTFVCPFTLSGYKLDAKELSERMNKAIASIESSSLFNHTKKGLLIVDQSEGETEAPASEAEQAEDEGTAEAAATE